MPGIASGIYNSVFRRNVVFLSTVFGGALLFEIGFDVGMTKLWDANNKGRQWKDIKHRYVDKDQ